MKLLAALDLADTPPAVLRETRAWADRLRAAVWLLHVAEPDPDFVGYEPGPDTVRAAVARKFHREHRQIEDAARDLRAAGLEATALLVQGPTAATILREAERLGADAILLGVRGHGALHDFLLGSVSRRVLHAAARPVLFVPARAAP